MKIIAEIGWNHMGDMALAENMIRSASSSGANIVKFQYWDPSLLAPGEWDNDGRREIYNKAALNEDKIKLLIDLCDEHKCEFLISVFGTVGAQLIYDMGQRKVKIPSHETTNHQLIKFCSNNFDEIYFSAGASTKTEVESAVEILERGDCNYLLMHCVSAYPCNEDSIYLSRIEWLKQFNGSVGFSDHTQSTVVPALAVMLGADVIEKHFTTNHNLPGRDNKFALEPEDFTKMVKNINAAEKTLINHGLDFQDIENDTVNNYRGRWEPHDYE